MLFSVVRSAFRHGVRRYGTTPPAPLLDELALRGLLHNATHRPALAAALSEKSQGVYAGVDPTGRSLHIGHLLPLMTLLHFHIRGHTVIPLIGGATGRIGDPSGRSVERQPAVNEQVDDNIASLTRSIQSFFARALEYAARRGYETTGPAPVVTSNLDWHKNTNLLDFLQHVGTHARVNTMLNRESVRTRRTSQNGLSFAEFTYQLLQAYDFYHLHTQAGCSIQVGGSDQWGNILAGLELISRLSPSTSTTPTQQPPVAFAITTPLLTTASGGKFGKSAGNAIWLDPDMTSVFDFYQYFVKVEDTDVEKYLKLLTLLPPSEITQIMEDHEANPEQRGAQRRLAAEVTEMVHTQSALSRAQTKTSILFSPTYTSLDPHQVLSALDGDPRLVLLPRAELIGTPVFKLAAKYGLVASASAAKLLVNSHGLYLNNQPVKILQQFVDPAIEENMIGGRVAVIRAGKDKFLILASEEQ